MSNCNVKTYCTWKVRAIQTCTANYKNFINADGFVCQLYEQIE